MPDRAILSRPTSFVDLLRDRAERHPERLAFVFMQEGAIETDRWTFAELDQRARAIAAHLLQRGLRGQRALLLYNPGLEFIAGFFGCLYADVTAVPAYPPRSNALLTRLASIIRDADVALALTAAAAVEGIAERLRDLEGMAAPELLATDAIDPAEGHRWQPPAIAGDDLAFLQYTSGSTGQPKGVMVSHANLLHNSRLINLCFEDGEQSIGVSWLPPYHDMGLVGGILQSLYAGSTTYLMPPVSFLQRPIRWLEAISRHRGTTAGGPNFAYEFCARQIRPEQLEGLDLSSWTLAFTGAEPVRPETLDLFCDTFGPCGFRREAFLPCYGLAENTLIVSGGSRHHLPLVRHFDPAALLQRQVVQRADKAAGDSRALVSCGPPLGELGVQLVDPETGVALPPGQIGEIWVRGGSVAQGYRNQEQRSRETFAARLPGDEAGYLRTGDLGFLLEGELFVNGRLKDLIIIRGSNHYPQDIEATVETCHGALRTGCGAAFSVEENGQEQLVVVQEVERSALRRLDADAVTAAIRAAVAERHQLVPAAILLLKTGAIPKTSSGKIQRFACRQRYLEGSFEAVGLWRQPAVAPRAVASELPLEAGHTAAPGQRSASPALAAAAPAAASLGPAAGTSPQERRLQAWFRQVLAAQLGLSEAAIDVDRPLAQYGLDSMAAVRLSADLDDWLASSFPDPNRAPISPTLVYDHPTIAGIAAALVGPGQAAASAPAGASSAVASAVAAGRPLRDEDIAVVGLACRFPQAPSPEAFWELLRQGGEGIRTAAAAGALQRGFGAPPAEQAGYLDQIERFDATFFGISPREAEQMDPQQRLLLETTWEAFERAGIPPDRWAGSPAGVFVGISSSDYAQLQPQEGTSVYWGTGNAHSIAANRLSYLLDLRGPSLAVDTACSSSLVAVHQAVRSLQQGESRQAIVAGVNLLLMPGLTETFRQAGMLAADGRCKPFDADADGYVRGEGCGVVLLKRLGDARRDGDRVWGVIAGSAVNQDGRSNGLTAPNGQAQQAVVRQALERAGVGPAALSYVEAHGTGTSLGDPIEVNALRAVLSVGRGVDQPCWLGSVKGNVGHLEAAAGMAGLIKLLLCFEHGALPPQRHLRSANPLIQLEGSPFRINTALQPWPGPERWAGVSSFGFGGTNAHVVLTAPPVSSSEATPEEGPEPAADRPCHLLTLSARCPEALGALQRLHARRLADPGLSPRQLADHCFSANVGRSHLPIRQAWVGASGAELAAVLESSAIASTASRGSGQRPTLAFLFTGQGSQYPGMAAELLASQPRFREVIERCDALLAHERVLPAGLTLMDLLRTPADEAERQHREALLEDTALTQPVLFCLEVALAGLWRSWGVTPDWVMGHSVGEIAAACVAGVFDLEAGVRLIAARARLMAALPAGGGMLAVFAGRDTVAAVLQQEASPLVIAADNGPANVVLSGSLAAIEAIGPVMEACGLVARRLRVSHAFHSPLMEPMLAPFREVAAAIAYREPQLPIVSNVSHEPIGAAMASADYWCRHVMAPVAFGAGLESLRQQGVEAFLEIGPKPTLVEMGRADGRYPDARWLASLRPDRPAMHTMLDSLAELYRLGVSIDWAAFDAPFPRRRVGLPTYPWQRLPHWLPLTRFPVAAPREPALHALQWQSQPRPVAASTRPPRQGQWLVCGPRWLAQGLAQALPGEQRCGWIEPLEGADFGMVGPGHWRLDPTQRDHWRQLLLSLEGSAPDPGLDPVERLPLLGVVQLAEADPATAAAAGQENLDLDSLLRRSWGQPALVQALLAHHWPAALPRLWWLAAPAAARAGKVAARVGAEPGGAAVVLEQGLADGFSRCLVLEHPELWGGWLEMPLPAAEAGLADLAHELALAAAGLPALPELRVRLEAGQRWVQRLVRLPQPLPAGGADHRAGEPSAAAPSATGPSVSGPDTAIPHGRVLISGGFGALGMATADWLVSRGVPSLLLVGRRPPSPAAQARLEAWIHRGIEVRVLLADVADAGFLPQVRAVLEEAGGPLRGIVHAAGLLEDATLERLAPDRWERVVRPKLVGAWQLHQLSLEQPVDLFVLYSSLAAVLGSPGQAAYGAANGALDALAAHRRSLGLPALSLNWGPWSGAGMADQGQQNSGRALERVGIEAESPQAYFDQLSALLDSSTAGSLPASVTVVRLQLATLRQRLAHRPQAALLRALEGGGGAAAESVAAGLTPGGPEGPAAGESQPAVGPRAGEPALRGELLALDPSARQERMFLYLQATLSRLLAIEPGSIEPDLHLMEAAADSLMVMDAISQIQTDLGLMLYPREIYEHPRVGPLCRYLVEALERSAALAAAPGSLPGPLSANLPGKLAQARSEEIADPLADESDEGLAEGLPEALRLPASLAARAAEPPPELAGQRLPPAIFVLSSPRAGSTLLRVMLAGHPGLFSPPELHLLPFATMGERARALHQSGLGEGLERALMDLEGIDGKASRALVQSWEEADLPVTRVYARLQERAGGRILVDKSPTYALHAETLQRAEAVFAQPLYIHLVRHPYSVIRSFVDLRMERLFGVDEGDPHRLAETIWRTCNRHVQDLAGRLGPARVHRVVYEELVARPEATVTDLCRFLGIPFDGALLTPHEGSRLTDGPHRQSLSVGDPNFGRRGRIDPSLAEAWRAVTLPRPLRSSSRKLAESFGYLLPESSRASAPPPAALSAPAASSPAAVAPAPGSAPLERREAFAAVRGLQLCRCEWGPADGPPVLCLHGLLDQGLIWEPVAQALAAAGYRVIAPDLRGHGRSDHGGAGGSYTPLEFIGDAVALVDQLLDQPFRLVGHSLGTVVASGVASLREERVNGLVLIEPVLPALASSTAVRDTVGTLVGYALEPPRHSVMASQAAAVDRLRRVLPTLAHDFAGRLVERATRREGEGWVWRWDAVLQTRMSLNLQSGPLHREAYRQLLGELRPPLEVIQGASSAFNRADDLADLRSALPQAAWRQLEGGHNLVVDNPAALSQALLQIFAAQP